MAGNYPDVPNNKIQYDLDGSVGLWIDSSNNVSVQANSLLRSLNDDSASDGQTAVNPNFRQCIILSRPHDITGHFARFRSNSGSPVGGWSWSSDTTTGVDGTWTSYSPDYVVNGSTNPDYRTSIQSISLSNVKALRVSYPAGMDGTTMQTWHLYGRPTSGANTDRLEIISPTLSSRIDGAYLDWGNAMRGSSADRTFRVKNLSSTLTATSVLLTFDTLTDASPSVPGMHLLSADGTNFTASLNIGNLAPGATSGVITVRRVVPSNATLSIFTVRVIATAGSWT